MSQDEDLSQWAGYNLFVQDRLYARATEQFNAANLTAEDQSRMDTAQGIMAGLREPSEVDDSDPVRFSRATALLSEIARTGEDTDGGVARRSAHESLKAIRFLSNGEGELSQK